MKHVVLFSGGIASWGTAQRVMNRHGAANLILLFCDTLMEDEDLYRFLGETAASIGGQLVRLAEGRTPWQVFQDERMMGNTRADPCSRILKRQMSDRWLRANCDPATTTVYLGYDWTEIHRYERSRELMLPWRIEAPLCEAPYLSRWDLRDMLLSAGITPPRLYRWSSHNNCGGFCVKAGIGHFVRLLTQMPERYRYHEEQEQAFRAFIGKDVSILRDRAGGATLPLTLRALRERYESGHQFDMFDIGGCGCFEEAPE